MPILKRIKPNVVTINETLLQGDRKLSLAGYKCYSLNRENTSGGGIATCILNQDYEHTLKIFEDKSGNEILITRHSQYKVPINVINIYGVCESRSKKDAIQERWQIVYTEICKIEAKNEYLVLIGDLNVHLGDQGHIKNNKKESPGGKLINNFLSAGDYVLVNKSEKAVGGPYTRIDPADPNKKSILDLCIISKELYPYVGSLKIDNDLVNTPYRTISRNKLVYTDHLSLILTFDNLPLASKVHSGARKNVRWNLNREGGGSRYKELTDDNKKLTDVAQNEVASSEVLMKNIDKELEHVKYKSFGKVRESGSVKYDKEVKILQDQKSHLLQREKGNHAIDSEVQEVENKIASVMMTKQRESFEKEMTELRD